MIVTTDAMNTQVQYPILKISSTGTIVLFIEPCTGTAIYSKSRWYPPGFYSKSWDEDNFTPYRNSVTLSAQKGGIMITTTAEEDVPVEYPILKINKTGMIVLFTGPRVGTIVHMIHKKNEYVQPGSHSRFWHDDDFKECAKSVTLKNKREKKDAI